MGAAHGDPAEIKRLAAQLRRASEEVNRLGGTLQGALRGVNWNDDVKRRIDADVQAAVNGLKSLKNQLDQHAALVDKKANELATYLGR